MLLAGNLDVLACEFDLWASRRPLGGGGGCGLAATEEALSMRDKEALGGKAVGALEPEVTLLPMLPFTLVLLLLALPLQALDFAGFPLLEPEAALVAVAGVLGPSKLVPGALPFGADDDGVGNWYGGAGGGRSKDSSNARSESSDTLAVDGSAVSSSR